MCWNRVNDTYWAHPVAEFPPVEITPDMRFLFGYFDSEKLYNLRIYFNVYFQADYGQAEITTENFEEEIRFASHRAYMLRRYGPPDPSEYFRG